MEKNSVDYSPLLSPRGDETAIKTTSFLVSATKWTLKTLILMIFVLWAAFIFFLPAKPVNELFSKWTQIVEETPLISHYALRRLLQLLEARCHIEIPGCSEKEDKFNFVEPMVK